MRKTLLLVVTVVAMAAAGVFATRSANYLLPGPETRIETTLKAEVARENAKLPRTQDDVRIDRITLPAPMTMQTDYTVLDIKAAEFEDADRTALTANTVKLSCTKADPSRLLNLGVTLIYQFSTADGVLIASVTVKKADCKRTS